LSGDVQVIENVPTTDAAKLKTDKRVAVYRTVADRLIYLHMDSDRDASPFVTDKAGKPLDKNPLKDVRVRKALSLAINRPAIVDRVMEGTAVPAGQYLPQGVYSHAPDIKPPPYDPEQAKKLLAEAGFPKGLRVTIHGPNDRYVNDSKIIQAVGQMWTRIGVHTEVSPLPWASYAGRANKQEFSAFLFGWGTGTAEASDPLIAQNATFNATKGWGASNRGRYSNPELDKLIEEALRTADDGAREKILQKAQKVAFDDVAIIPLHIQKNIWATRAGFSYVPTVGEGLKLVNVKPVK